MDRRRLVIALRNGRVAVDPPPRTTPYQTNRLTPARTGPIDPWAKLDRLVGTDEPERKASKPRACLTCRTQFESFGPENQMCPRCRHENNEW